MERVLPDAYCPEPVYIYEDPNAHPINLEGVYLDQKGAYRISMITSTPETLDRLCKVKTLEMEQNYDYAIAWSGAVNDFQRKVDVKNMEGLSDWWADADSISPNTPLCWLPAVHPFQYSAAHNGTIQTISPAVWCFDECPQCKETATQYGRPSGWFFDCCRSCWADHHFCSRPGMIIDGQHRIRGMAKVDSKASKYHQQPIFAAFLSEAAPKGVPLSSAARLFIEINAGAAPLKQLHQDYLASHFKLFEYSNTRRHTAYNVGVTLNVPASPNEWAEDTGSPGRAPQIGRVALMPTTWTADYLDVSGGEKDDKTKGTIEEWCMRVVDASFDVPAVGGGSTSRTPYGSSTTIHGVLVEDLRYLLSAATNVWPGAAGVAKTLPYWRTDRGRPHGELQQKRVFRILMNMLPIISARLDEQGITRSRSNIETELKAISNITFTGAWDQYLTGDSGVGLVTRILTTLYRNAPYPTPPSYWVDLPTWFAGPHDPITVLGFAATTTGVEFRTETVSSVCPSGPITDAVSLIGVNDAYITIENKTAKTKYPRRTFSIKRKVGATNVVAFSDIAVTPPSLGDLIEMKIEVSKKFSTTLVPAAVVSDTVV